MHQVNYWLITLWQSTMHDFPMLKARHAWAEGFVTHKDSKAWYNKWQAYVEVDVSNMWYYAICHVYIYICILLIIDHILCIYIYRYIYIYIYVYRCVCGCVDIWTYTRAFFSFQKQFSHQPLVTCNWSIPLRFSPQRSDAGADLEFMNCFLILNCSSWVQSCYPSGYLT